MGVTFGPEIENLFGVMSLYYKGLQKHFRRIQCFEEKEGEALNALNVRWFSSGTNLVNFWIKVSVRLLKEVRRERCLPFFPQAFRV